MKLYEIDERILECIDLETGEIIDEETLNELELERETKIENLALWYKNLTAEAEAYKREKDGFADKEKRAKNKADSLKQYLDKVLSGNKFKTTKVSISYRKSEAVKCEDISLVEDDYLRFKEPELDKAKVKEAIKAGVEIKGCALVENMNIQIK